MTGRTTRKTLAADRARITRSTIVLSIIALLSEGTLPDTVSTSSRSSTAADDVWKTDSSIAKGLRASSDDVLCNCQGLEAIDTDGWVDREGFMDTATPVGEGGVGECTKGW